MATYLDILKIVLKNNFRSIRGRYLDDGSAVSERKKKMSRAANVIGITLGLGVTVVMLYLMIHIMSLLCAIEGISAYFLSMLLTTAQIMIIFFGMSSVLSNTFFSKDNEFLSSLPVKSTTVFAVKMTVIYLNELVVSIVFMVPILAAFLSGSIVGGVSIPIYFYFLIPLIILTEPIIPLVVISLFSFPMIKVISYFKNKSVVTLVASLVLFGGFFALYMLFIPNIEKFVTIEGQASLLTPQMRSVFIGFGKAMFFNKAFAAALLGTKFWINMLIFVATIIGSIGLAVLMSAVLYKKAAGVSGEETRKKANVTLSSDVDSPKKALMKREIRCLFRNQSFAFNSVAGSVTTPLIILVMDLMSIDSATAATTGQTYSYFAQNFSSAGFILFYCMMLLCGMNYTASLAFSREGDTFYVLRYLPVELKDVINIKINLANVVSLVGIVFVGIISFAFSKLHVLNALPMLVVIALYAYAFNTLGVYRDLRKPNVTWTSPYEVIKRNFYPMIPMFISMALGATYMLVSQLITKYENAVSLSITVNLFWVLTALIAVVMIVIVKLQLKKNARDFFDRVAFDN